MSDYDVIVRGVLFSGERFMLGVGDGKIVAAGETLAGSAREEVGGDEYILCPGWIDAHVHFNEPGRGDWEGIETGSRAFALGGGTVFFDMPLNSTPPVVDGASLREKRKIAEAKSLVDFALWGGLVPGSVDRLEEMAEAGVIGFKAFMCHSGLDEFPAADAKTLKAGMVRSAALGLPVAVHAEMGASVPVRGSGMKDWFASRPKEMELDAITLACDLAGESGCPLQIVHVSTPEGLDLIAEAKAAGVDVTAETCPHYLLIDVEQAALIGAEAKCAPPLQSRERIKQLWQRLGEGKIDSIGSDHSPAPPAMKRGDDIFAIWGGIAGIQHGLPLLWDAGLRETDLISRSVAERFRLADKGGLDVGKDADFSLLTVKDPGDEIERAKLVTRHALSPYVGMTLRHQAVGTWLRGVRVGGHGVATGKFLTPDQNL